MSDVQRSATVTGSSTNPPPNTLIFLGSKQAQSSIAHLYIRDFDLRVPIANKSNIYVSMY